MYEVSTVNLGIQHAGAFSALSVYPNPANDRVNLEIEGYSGPINVEICLEGLYRLPIQGLFLYMIIQKASMCLK